MARMGRPPKPAEAKRRIGNPGGRPLPGNVVALAPAADSVTVLGDTPGDELVASLLASPASAWIADPDRLVVLELLRDGWNERARLRAAVDALPDWAAGRYVPAAVLRLERVERELTTWLSLLGLTPTDRSRLGVAEVKARSKLDELRARREARSRAG